MNAYNCIGLLSHGYQHNAVPIIGKWLSIEKVKPLVQHNAPLLAQNVTSVTKGFFYSKWLLLCTPLSKVFVCVCLHIVFIVL